MTAHEQHASRRRNARGSWALLAFLAIAAYFLLSEHRAHFIYGLPFVLVFACALLHLFHRNDLHGARAGHRDDAQDTRREVQPSAGPQPRHEGDHR